MRPLLAIKYIFLYQAVNPFGMKRQESAVFEVKNYPRNKLRG